jgi:predicted metal-dependent phosphoesterase TrpH
MDLSTMRTLILLVAACSSSHPDPTSKPPPVVVTPATLDAAGGDHRHWLAGDLHMHVAPPDSDDVTASIADITKAAVTAGMDFIVLTPHIWNSQWDEHRDEVRRAWRTFATDARAVKELTLIPGAEWTTTRGHYTVTGVDIAALDHATGSNFLPLAKAAGAYISVNHPFAVPSHIPNVHISDFNMSYRVWTDRAPGFTAIDGAEVWNVPLSFANLVATPGGHTAEELTWTELDRVVHQEHRAVTAVGGTDDHHGHVLATTYVLATDPSEASILGALRAGATCVGGAEAGSFRAHSTESDWVTIGGDILAATIDLVWTGPARLFIDGIDRGEHTDGYIAQTGGELHTYRIVVGRSRSGFIYANL